jgi:hypothetical protein
MTGERHVARLLGGRPPAITILILRGVATFADVEVPTMTRAALPRVSVPDRALVALAMLVVLGWPLWSMVDLAEALELCRTDPQTGGCVSQMLPVVTTQINGRETPTFAIFVFGNGVVPFNPATNRVFVRLKDAGNITRGSTSVAVTTQ